MLKKKAAKLLSCLLALAMVLGSIAVLPPAATQAATDYRYGTGVNRNVVKPLKEVYADHFMIGTVISGSDPGDSTKWAHMTNHFNAVTPENATKPDSIWAISSGAPTGIASAQTMIQTANNADFYTIGHALAWHNQSQTWPPRSGDLDRDQRPLFDPVNGVSEFTFDWDYNTASSRLEEYIKTIAGSFTENASLNAWDVVNEAMRVNPEHPEDWRNALRQGSLPALRPSYWYGSYSNEGYYDENGIYIPYDVVGNGWDYIYDAFVFARKSAPDATLIYNDFNDEELENKAIAIAEMVKELNALYAEEYPEDPRMLIEVIGIQAHYNLRLRFENLERVLQIYAETGCKIALTELDVSITNSYPRGVVPSEEEYLEQAVFYAKLMLLLKEYSEHINRVTWWGVSDQNSWRSEFYPMPWSRTGSYQTGFQYVEKEAFWAVMDPEGYLGVSGLPELTSFQFDGETFSVDPLQTVYDVHVPDDVTNISFGAANVNAPSNTEVSVTLNPANGAVSPGQPCEATVTVIWQGRPDVPRTYTISFGHMQAEWLKDQNYDDTGYRSLLDVRFSDGETALTLAQEFRNRDDGTLELINTQQFDALPRHESGRYVIATDDMLTETEMDSLTLTKSVWDQSWNLFSSAYLTDFQSPDYVWQLADSIEADTNYILVNSATEQALTHEGHDSIQAGGGISEATQGYYGTNIVVEDGVIVTPSVIQDNIRFYLREATHPSPGTYRGDTPHTLQSLVHGGLIQPYIIWRADVDTPTASLHSNTHISDANLDRGAWFHTPLEDGETTLFLYSGASSIYALMGNSSGFAAEKITNPESAPDGARFQVFEYVPNYSYEELTSLGMAISYAPLQSIPIGRNVNIPVAAAVSDGCDAVLLKNGVVVASATFTDGKAVISVDGDDIDDESTYAIVVYDDDNILGAVSIPATVYSLINVEGVLNGGYTNLESVDATVTVPDGFALETFVVVKDGKVVAQINPETGEVTFFEEDFDLDDLLGAVQGASATVDPTADSDAAADDTTTGGDEDSESSDPIKNVDVETDADDVLDGPDEEDDAENTSDAILEDDEADDPNEEDNGEDAVENAQDDEDSSRTFQALNSSNLGDLSDFDDSIDGNDEDDDEADDDDDDGDTGSNDTNTDTELHKDEDDDDTTSTDTSLNSDEGETGSTDATNALLEATGDDTEAYTEIVFPLDLTHEKYGEGIYTLYAKFDDGEVYTYEFTVDHTVPEIDYDSRTGRVTVTDTNLDKVLLDGLKTTSTFVLSSSGTYHVEATDKAGNYAEMTIVVEKSSSGNRGSGSRRSSGNGGSSSGWSAPPPPAAWLNGVAAGDIADVTQAAALEAVSSAVSAAQSAGAATAAVRFLNPGWITQEIMQAMTARAGEMPLIIHADAMNGNAVDVRLYVNPALATGNINLAASTINTRATSCKAQFERWFTNQLMVASLEHNGAFGQTMEIAVKLTPELANSEELVIYAYDSASNTYAILDSQDQWVDSSGYLHFRVGEGGDYVISAGALARR